MSDSQVLPPLPHLLLHMLEPYPNGVQIVICWKALRNTVLPRLSYGTVKSAVWRNRQTRCLTRVGWGRYALSPEFRTMCSVLEQRERRETVPA